MRKAMNNYWIQSTALFFTSYVLVSAAVFGGGYLSMRNAADNAADDMTVSVSFDVVTFAIMIGLALLGSGGGYLARRDRKCSPLFAVIGGVMLFGISFIVGVLFGSAANLSCLLFGAFLIAYLSTHEVHSITAHGTN